MLGIDEIGIEAIEAYLPEGRLGNTELVEVFGFEPEFLSGKLGITQRTIAGSEEATSDMAVAAAERLFTANPALSRAEVGLLIVCTQNPDYKLPHTSAIVQDRLGLPRTTAALDINLGCSGFVYGLAVAKGMMQTLGLRDALLITADPYQKIISPEDRSNRPLFGDASAATWLRSGGRGRLGRFDLGTDGGQHLALVTPGGGTRHPAGPGGTPTASPHLHMDGRAIFNFMMKRAPATVNACLEANGLSLADIELFVFHQASRYMLESLARRLKIGSERLVLALDQTGNTVSSSIPLALAPHLPGEKTPAGPVLLCGFGVGLSWGTTILFFT